MNLNEAIAKAIGFLTQEKEKRVELEVLPQECKDAKYTDIKQGFIREVRLDNHPFCDVRIRKETNQKGKVEYTLTAKYRPKNEESTVHISEDTFNTLWPRTASKQEKRRYKLNNSWTVDDIKTDKRIVAEYETSGSINKVTMPMQFKIKGAGASKT